MQRKWTSVLVTAALAGSFAATTGIAASQAAVDNHPMVEPVAQAPNSAKTLAALGDLGQVLHAVSELASAGSPANGAAADPTVLKGQLAQLDTAANSLKASMPASGSTAGGQSAPAPAQQGAPGNPAAPGVVPGAAPGVVPGFPAEPERPGSTQLMGDQSTQPGGQPVQLGGPIQRSTVPARGGVAEQLTVLRQHAAALVAAASAEQPNKAAVQQALTPLTDDALTLSTATVNRLAGGR
jgi:hypothetical protein